LTGWGPVRFSRMSLLHVVRIAGLRAKIWTQYLPTIQHEFQPHSTVTLCSAFMLCIFRPSTVPHQYQMLQDISCRRRVTELADVTVFTISSSFHPTNQVLTKHESGSNTPRLTTSRHLLSSTLTNARPFTKTTAILCLANCRYQTSPTETRLWTHYVIKADDYKFVVPCPKFLQ